MRALCTQKTSLWLRNTGVEMLYNCFIIFSLTFSYYEYDRIFFFVHLSFIRRLLVFLAVLVFLMIQFCVIRFIEVPTTDIIIIIISASTRYPLLNISFQTGKLNVIYYLHSAASEKLYQVNWFCETIIAN